MLTLCRDAGFACILGDVWLWVWTCTQTQFKKARALQVLTCLDADFASGLGDIWPCVYLYVLFDVRFDLLHVCNDIVCLVINAHTHLLIAAE